MSESDFADRAVEEAPGWLQKPYGRRFLFALGVIKDAVLEGAKIAVKVRFPLLAPSDALDVIGRERGIDKGFYFSDSQYRKQLVNAFGYWRRQGTAAGLIQALGDAGYRNVQVYENYTGDGIDPSEWSWFYVQFLPPYPWTVEGVAVWDDNAIWDDDRAWVDPVPPSEAERVRSIIRKLKPSHAKPAGAAFLLSGQLWNAPERIWDAGLTWSGVVAQIDV
ncbi:phage tail protein [Pendulispora brunnea]|uniref:Phage tail protein n=1 Tax=Pendulispora brunnea TaxID=2905690 RepID=A0ABZ2K7D1_9BACT